MKQIILALLIFIFSTPVWAGLNVITTTTDLAALATEIGGNKVRVNSLTKGTRDPHYAQAKPSMIRKAFRADLLILVGAEMEIGWLPALIQSSRNSRISVGQSGYLDLSSFVSLKGKSSGRVTRDMGDVHAAGNPHYWLDPANGIVMAKAITERLSKLDSANAMYYQSRFTEFEIKLQERIKQWKIELKKFSGQRIIAYHTSLLYLADAFNLDIRGYVEPKPGLAPSVSHLNQLIKNIRNEKISYLLMEPYYETRSADLLKRKSAISTIVIPQSVGARPEIKTYIELFDAIVNAFKSVEK